MLDLVRFVCLVLHSYLFYSWNCGRSQHWWPFLLYRFCSVFGLWQKALMMLADISRIAEPTKKKKNEQDEKNKRATTILLSRCSHRTLRCQMLGKKRTSIHRVRMCASSSGVCFFSFFFFCLLLSFWLISFVFCLSTTKEHSRLNAPIRCCGFPNLKWCVLTHMSHTHRTPAQCQRWSRADVGEKSYALDNEVALVLRFLSFSSNR